MDTSIVFSNLSYSLSNDSGRGVSTYQTSLLICSYTMLMFNWGQAFLGYLYGNCYSYWLIFLCNKTELTFARRSYCQTPAVIAAALKVWLSRDNGD